MKNISRSIPKVDHLEKVTGSAKYVSDIKMDHMIYAKTLRSTHAHAHIISIKYPQLTEGYFIIDYKDIPHDNYVKMIFKDWKIFADHVVNYVGEPIALFIGPKLNVIKELIESTEVIYELFEPTFDDSHRVIHKSFKKGNPEQAFKHPAYEITHTYETGYQEQAYIETQGFLGYLESEHKVTLIGSIQCPYYVKHAVVEMLQCKSEDVRVIQAAVGGAFGGKEEFPSLLACQLTLAVLKSKKPVKLIYEREEDMVSTTKRHPSKIKLQAALNEKKKIVGLKAQVSLDGGAYIGLSGVVLSRAMLAVTSAYTIEHLDVCGAVHLTHTVPNGAFRGFGAPQMIFAIEMFMNHVAKDLDIDPFEFRLNHLVKQGDLTSTSGVFRDPIILKDMIHKATEVSSYIEKVKAYQDKNIFKGIGISVFLHGCGFTGSGESKHINANVRLEKDEKNHVYIYVAAVDMGQGVFTTLKKIVAQTLEIPIEQVTFNPPDTDVVPDSGPTVASRTIMIVGGLLKKAADTLKETWIDQQHMMIEKRYEQPDFVTWDEEKLQGDAYPAYSWGVNVVEVEVSPITYQVDVKDIWSVYDLGKAIDEKIVLGQADGGIAQGIGYGYLEVMRHEEGYIKQKNMTDYIILSSVDMPKTQTFLYDNPFDLGPFGAKGVGELTLVGGAPAVALAIEMAIGKKVKKIPATPEYIMEMMINETY